MKNKIFTLVIIGLGNIGLRYLEGAIKSDVALKVFCYDKKNTIKKLKLSNKYSDYKDVIFFEDDIKNLPKYINILIIATTSNIRFNLSMKLILLKKISNLVLEKVVFQRVSHFHDFYKIINKKKINTYISMPRRYYPVYKFIKKQNLEKFHIKIDSNQLGLGCNLIHFIDLFIFLSACHDFKLINNLDKKIINAKRKNFIEFLGEIEIKNNNYLLNIKDYQNLDSPKKLLIKIKFKNKIVVIDEIRKTVKINGVRIKELEKFPYMSELWQSLPSEILVNKRCELSFYNDDYKHHIKMINFYNNHISDILQKKVYISKIT